MDAFLHPLWRATPEKHLAKLALSAPAVVLMSCLILMPTKLGATDCCDPRSPFREGEGWAERAASCENIAYWADRAPKTSARFSLAIRGKLSAVTSDSALAYLVMCDPPGLQVICVTYQTNGMTPGEVVEFGGGLSTDKRQTDRHGPLSCLTEMRSEGMGRAGRLALGAEKWRA
jgi:hypothetical protein